MAAFIEPVMAKLAEQASYWQAYADAFDFRQGELPLSSWRAPAVRAPTGPRRGATVEPTGFVVADRPRVRRRPHRPPCGG
jgi:hypothetical protein